MQEKPDPKKRKGDDLSIPPWFDLPKSFYRQLAASAKEFGITRQAFLAKAVQYYSAHLRKENAPLSKALGDTELADLFAEARRKTAKEWWDKLSPEERSARAKRASDARKGGKTRRDTEFP